MDRQFIPIGAFLIGNIVWNVVVNGHTKLSGSGINGGNPIGAHIAHHVGANVYILAVVTGLRTVKMVKIQVTGENTLDWLEARHHQAPTGSKCLYQETFYKDCFHGNTVN